MRSLWVNGFGAGGPLGESVQKAGVSGRAAQGRKREQERKLLPGLVWGVGGKDGKKQLRSLRWARTHCYVSNG